MHIINVRHNRNNRWKTKAKNRDRKKPRSGASYSESVRAKWFCCAFKLSFVQLICKVSLIFKLNLQLALSIMDGDSGDKKNGDAVDDDGSDANWGDGENIVNCGEDKVGGDSIGDGGVDTNDGSDPDFGDDKTKVGYSDDTADYDDNSDNDGGPNNGGGVMMEMMLILMVIMMIMLLMEIKMIAMAMKLMVVVLKKDEVVMMKMMIKMVVEMIMI